MDHSSNTESEIVGSNEIVKVWDFYTEFVGVHRDLDCSMNIEIEDSKFVVRCTEITTQNAH